MSPGGPESPPQDRRSRFFDDVDPEAPHPDYPRPQLRRNQWTNLNGWWDLAVLDRAAPMPTAYPGRVLVPYPIGSVLSGVEQPVRPDERAWLRRTFIVDRATLAGRLRLHFGAVDWECRVRCDGVEVAHHRGGYDPFHVDLTEALSDGPEHELVVSVWDPTDEGPQPLGKQSLHPAFIWYPALSGIWQTVWLEPVAASCIESVVAVTALADQRVSVRVTVGQPSPGDRVHCRALADGEPVAEASAALVDADASCELVIDGLRPWSPEDPYLYDLDVALRRGDDDIDRVDSYFGAREVGVARDGDGVLRLTLNGQPRFHLGLLDQGWWPDGLYTAPTDEALVFDIEATRAMGFNTIRKHVKVEPARWYWHADRLGMLVWQDMPSTPVDAVEMGRQLTEGIAPVDMDWSKVSPAGDPQGFRRELDALIDALMAFACVVVWVPFNESWGQHDTEATLRHMAARDPSRLIDGPSGWVDGGEGHIRDHHTYFSEAQFPGLDPARPVVYGEYGGYTLTVAGHRLGGDTFGYGDKASAEELADAYTQLTTTIQDLKEQGLAGAIYTQTTDVEGEINGLLTYDRVVQKIPTSVLLTLHAPLTAPD